MGERRADCMSKQMGHFLVSSSYIHICAMQVAVLFKIKGKSYYFALIIFCWSYCCAKLMYALIGCVVVYVHAFGLITCHKN